MVAVSNMVNSRLSVCQNSSLVLPHVFLCAVSPAGGVQQPVLVLPDLGVGTLKTMKRVTSSAAARLILPAIRSSHISDMLWAASVVGKFKCPVTALEISDV